MCYSAQLEEAHRRYVRETGATIDLLQFKEIFSERAAHPAIRIPRAMERWFDHPTTTDERDLKALIEAHREHEITALERELFALRKRLADAERKLAIKPTKAAAESARIATSKGEKAKARLDRLKDAKPRKSDARIFPMHYAPIVIEEHGQRLIRLARYHCRGSRQSAGIDRKFPGLYNARRDNLERFWRHEFGTTHAVMLVNSFYENVDRDGRNAVLHFTPRPAQTMLIACLYATWTDPKSGKDLLSFAAITDDPPAEVAAAGHDRMIVNLKPANLAAWVTPQGRSHEELQAILSDREAPYYEHEVLAA